MKNELKQLWIDQRSEKMTADQFSKKWAHLLQWPDILNNCNAPKFRQFKAKVVSI